jgi:hypothetical protein
MILEMKNYLRVTLQIDVPDNFSDREILKFLQANAFSLDRAGVKLTNHFKWLSKLSGITVTP